MNTRSPSNVSDGTGSDLLMTRYREGTAIEGAKPSDAVRMHVLAHSERVARQSALRGERRNASAANDSRWRFAGMAAAFVTAGVAGWLAHQYFSTAGGDAQQSVASATPTAPSAAPTTHVEATGTAAAPTVAAPAAARNESVVPPAADASVAAATDPVRTGPPVQPSKATAQGAGVVAALERSRPAIAATTEVSRPPVSATASATDVAAATTDAAASTSSTSPSAEQRVAILETQKRALRREAAPPPPAAPMVMAAPPPPKSADAPVARAAATSAAGDLQVDRSATLSALLLAAVQIDDAARVDQLLLQGANPNLSVRPTKGGNEQASSLPLGIAAERGNAAVLDRLLRAGADVNAVDAQGRSALAIARAAGREAIVKRLLEAGAR